MAKRYFKALTKTQYEVVIRIVSQYGDPGIIRLQYLDIKQAKLRVNVARGIMENEAVLMAVRRTIEDY